MDEYAIVVGIVSEIVEEEPPLLFDLTALQKEANQALGLSAAETEKRAQKLYEAGALSYPRTSSHYITPDMAQSVAALASGAGGGSVSGDSPSGGGCGSGSGNSPGGGGSGSGSADSPSGGGSGSVSGDSPGGGGSVSGTATFLCKEGNISSNTEETNAKAPNFLDHPKIIPPNQTNGGTFNVKVPEARFIGDSPVSGAHNATIKIIEPDGKVSKVWREVSGHATESEMALGAGKMRQATHTEQRALTRFDLTNQTILITGQNPPCKNCQGAMRLKTLNNDGTIIYQWREKGKTKQAKWKHGKKIM